jgi:hypothetical protein
MILAKLIKKRKVGKNSLSKLITVSSLTLTTALATVPVSAAVINFQPGTEGKDAYVDSRNYNPSDSSGPAYNTLNWGSEPRMLLGEVDTGQGRTDTLIQFDLSTLPSISVSKVSLILTTLSDLAPSGVEPFLASAYRITSAWDENTVTWNSRPSFDSTSVASTTVDDIASTSFEWDITSLYLDWKNGVVPNLGIYLTGETIAGEGVSFVSSDNTDTPALRPILRVETIDVASVPEPTSTLAFLTLGALGTASAIKRKLSQEKKSNKQDN